MRSLWFFSVFLLLRLGSPGSEAAPSAPPPTEPSKTYNAEGGVVPGAPSASETSTPTPKQSGSPETPRSIPPQTSRAESPESPDPAPPGSARPESPKASGSTPTATSQAGFPESPSPRPSGTPDSSAVRPESPASPSPGLSGASDLPAQTSSPEPPGSQRYEPAETAVPAPETPSSEPPGLGQAESPEALSLLPPESSPGPRSSASETARAAPSLAPPEPSQMGSLAAPSLGSPGSPSLESGSPETPAQESGSSDPRPPAAARLLEPPAAPEPPARLRPLPRRRGSDTVNTIIVVERVQETGVTLVGRPRGATGGALCLFLAGAGLLLGVFLLLWCLYRRAARSRPFGHHRLPDDGDELALHLDAPKDPYDLHFYAPDAWVPSHIATKQPPGTPPLPPKLPPPPGRASSPPRLEPLSPAALPNNFV